MVGMVESQTDRDGRIGRERRYYLCSAKLDAETFARVVRSHWGIENRLHWVLDVVFRDDLARLRTGHGPANMAVVKHMALNLLRQATPALTHIWWCWAYVWPITRACSRSSFPRPYIWRLTSLSLVICPSV